MTRTVCSVSLVIVATASVASAQERVEVPLAEEGPVLRGWGITPYAGTYVGLGAGFGVEAETPFRLRFAADIGFVPSAYAWGAREFYVATHDGREQVGDLIEELSEFSTVAGAHASYRPWAHHGFFFGVGYTLQHAQKDGLVAARIADATDVMLPNSDGNIAGGALFTTNEYVHCVNARVGWQWGLGEGFTFRAAVGYAKVVHADVDLSPLFDPSDGPATMAFQDVAERRIEDAHEDYSTPTLSVELGYTFR